MKIQALRLEAKGQPAQLRTLELPALARGQVQIRVKYSSLNYKDALTLSGAPGFVKTYPLTAGLDAAGVVSASDDPRYPIGTEVIVTGCGLGEHLDGAYSEVLTVDGQHVVPRPQGLSLREAMILGTAGFSAALALHRLKANDQTPAQGPLAVTGASGGVGGFAIALLKEAGFDVWAVSGKPDADERLKDLGADRILRPEELGDAQPVLNAIELGGAVDNVGGEVLARLLPRVAIYGNVVTIGMAGGTQMPSSLLPLLLRGVSLLGVTATNCPYPLRQSIWTRLATDWKIGDLNAFVDQEVSLSDIPRIAQEMLQRKTQARTLVAF